MNGYIVLSVLLLAAMIACLVLALRLKKERKASQFAISAFREDHTVRLTASRPLETIQAVTHISREVPENIAQMELAHKIAARLPEFWRLEKQYIYGYDVEYRASVLICRMEGGE